MTPPQARRQTVGVDLRNGEIIADLTKQLGE